MPPTTSYTHPLTHVQARALRDLMEVCGFEFVEKPYTLFAGRKGKLNVAVYEKGPKVLVQGKETEDFVRFQLEPNILGEAKLGYEEIHQPEMFEPHFGIDESGKGDFFGPLVIAGAYVDREIARGLLDLGVQDSKRIKSDSKIRALAGQIRSFPGIRLDIVAIYPERYNQLHAKFGNLNRLLAWGHARVLENLLEKEPGCRRALSDQFANPRELERAVLKRGREIHLEQRTKAESDIAVAAASIIARERFIDWMEDQGKLLGLPTLPKGASCKVKDTAEAIVREKGRAALPGISKMHFKTAREVIVQAEE